MTRLEGLEVNVVVRPAPTVRSLRLRVIVGGVPLRGATINNRRWSYYLAVAEHKNGRRRLKVIRRAETVEAIAAAIRQERRNAGTPTSGLALFQAVDG